MSRRGLAIVAFLAFVLVVIWVVRSRESEHAAHEGGQNAGSGATTHAGTDTPSTSEREGPTTIFDAAHASSATMKWGSGKGELGRNRPTEGNPEGPMSFAVVGKDLLIVDQVNQRLLRVDANGNVKGTHTISPTVQDVAVAKDGTVALLDRLGDKNVTLSDASGHRIGTLPLGTDDPGKLTGIFVDGNTVYVEDAHGGLDGIGTTDGQPLASPQSLGGRPTKDGALLVTGALAPSEGKLTVNAIDRATGTSRFARLVQMPKPSNVIVLLDSDDRGVVYAGVAAGEPESATIACLDPKDGHVLGRVVMPMSQDPEETFRDFSVEGDGTIVHAVPDESGMTYANARCP